MNKDPDVKDCLTRRAEQCGKLKGKLAALKSLIALNDPDKEIDTKTQIEEVHLVKDNHNLVMKELKLLCNKRGLDPAEFEESSFTLNSEVSRVIAFAQKQMFDLKREKMFIEESMEESLLDVTVVSSVGASKSEDVSNEDQKAEILQLRRQLQAMSHRAAELDSTREHVEVLQDMINKQNEDHEEETNYYKSTTDALRKDLEGSKTTDADGKNVTSTPTGPARGRLSFGDYSRVGLGQEELFAISHVVGKSQADVMKHMLDDSQDQRQKFYTKMHMPLVELRKFEGDLTKYQAFVSRFDDLVGSTDCPYSVKLNTLLQFCGKDVLRHLGCCEHGQPREGYEMARKILKTKYGKPYLVANAWLEKVMDYPRLQSPENVAMFASELRSAKETLQSMGYLSELDNTDKRRLIISKLPSFVQNRWRKLHREANDKGRNVTFNQLIDLITQAGDEMDDPIYGAESLAKLSESYESKKAPVKRKQLTSRFMEKSDETIATPVKPEAKFVPRAKPAAGKFGGEPCGICQGDHFTRRCPEFENMSPEERAKLVKDKKMCLMCLSVKHFIKDCRFDWVCQIKGCTGKHNTTLHAALTQGRHEPDTASSRVITATSVDEDRKAQQPGPCKTLSTRCMSGSLEVYALPIVPVRVHGPGFTVDTNLMLDTGGSFTAISERLKNKARLKAHKHVTFNLGTITADETVTTGFVTFEVSGLLSDTKYAIINATVLDKELADPESVDALRNLSTWPHLREMKLPLHETSDVDILVGQDNAHLLSFEEKIPDITWRGPKACMTPLGWTIFGLNLKMITSRRESYTMTRNVTERLCQAVERTWALDDVPKPPVHTPENQKVLDLWEAEAKMVDGHVQLPLPIKGGEMKLPNNEEGVLKRHESLGKRLMRNPDLRKKFTEEMHKNFSKGYAEDAKEEAREGYEWYHPTQPVVSDKKPGKCRIVGDLAYRFRGRCLNDEISQGPNFTKHIAEVMTKFRRYKVAVTGDLEKMYNQVRVPPEQRDCLRFHWWKDDDPTQEVTRHRMTTQMFGGIWSASAAMFALVWLATIYSKEYAQRVIETILDHFYVDDMLDSLVEVDKTIRWLKQVRELLMKANFNLVKIGSNSQAVLDSIPVEARAPLYAEISFDKGDDVVDYTVGSVWRPLEDTLGFRAVKIDRPKTRRGVLSVMSSLYDPLGLVAPFVLLARIVLQEICRAGYEWDEPISSEYQNRWEVWLDGLKHVEKFTIPRWLNMTDDDDERYQMHVFSDASEAGYGVVLYLLIKNVAGEVKKTQLLCSKAKVTPVKPVTIPRLELTAAVVAVKMEGHMRKYLAVDMEPSVFWCDSQIVLDYLKGEAWQYKTFVSHRVLFIQEHSEVEQWRHVPGEKNVADKASRGMTGQEIFESKLWRDGPEFLMNVEDWPKPKVKEVEWDNLEIRRRVMFKYTVHVDRDGTDVRRRLLERYSSWRKLIRIMAAWMRILDYLRSKGSAKPDKVMIAEEYVRAEALVVRMAQAQYITTEQRKSRIFEKLFPYSEDGVLRVGGRLMRATLTYEEKYPAILPKCPLQESYIRHMHEKCGHGGIERTYTEVRQRYWVLGGKTSVKKVVQQCTVCKKIRGGFGEQIMAPLPEHRVAEGRAPFERVGIDYFGPVQVKINRTTQKRWICMMVCLATRAVHIEPAHDLSTASFLNVLQRFVSRRGKPKLLVSDNGTNFVGAKREMREALAEWNQEQIGKYMAEHEIEWRFNTPTASHHGGVWERLIRSARNLIMALVKDQVLNDDRLNTMVCSVEQIMNSRPLTMSTGSPGEPLPITPSHLLNLRQAEGLPGSFEKGDTLDLKWKQVQYLADLFWRRWTGEYLKTLQERVKWNKVRRNFAVGDVVLMLMEGTPRLKWPLARVEEVIIGRDDLVRSVKVKNKDGTYLRPITKLVPLECDLG